MCLSSRVLGVSHIKAAPQVHRLLGNPGDQAFDYTAQKLSSRSQLKGAYLMRVRPHRKGHPDNPP